MADIYPGYQNADAHGVPAFEVLDVYKTSNLVAGAEPAIQQPVRILLDDSKTLAQFTVVGLTSAGKLTPAVYNATVASGVVPVGVLMQPATSGSSNTTIYGEVSLTGCFNVGSTDAAASPDSPLVWDSTFDTILKKTSWAGHVGNALLRFRKRLV